MKSVILSVSLVLCYVSYSLAAVALGPAQVHSSHPNHCYVESKKEFYKPGDSWTEEDCTQASCVQVNYTGQAHLMISYATCGVVAVDPPCYLSENKALSYPACCPEPVCPEEESVEEHEQESSTKNNNNNNKNRQDENIFYKYNKNSNNNKNAYLDQNDSFENELTNDVSRHNTNNGGNAFRSYPWDDDYLYNDQDQDHMDNNVEDLDLQYLDYYPTDRRVSPRFSRQDFNMANFKWF